MVLGRFRDAKAFFERNGGAHPYDAVDLAFYSGDEGKARENLTAWLQLDGPVTLHHALLAFQLQVPDWERKVAASPPSDGLRGVMALQEGHTTEAASFFQQSFDQRRGNTAATAEGLSIALERSGDFLKAAEALEKASPERVEDPCGWLWNQARLAWLYRKLERTRDAQRIEDQLRKLLAVADPDHPILRQLPKL
jgi:tetratricopeptide (TPR) repeat protein